MMVNRPHRIPGASAGEASPYERVAGETVVGGPSEPRLARTLARVAAVMFLAMCAVLLVLIALFYDHVDFNFAENPAFSALPSIVSVILGGIVAGVLMLALVWVSRRNRDRNARPRTSGASGQGEAGRMRGTRSEGTGASGGIGEPGRIDGAGGMGERGGRRPFVPIVWGASLVLFVLQILLIGAIYGFPGWDPGNILSHAILLATGQDVATPHALATGKWITEYYDLYPNNAFLTWVFMGLSSVAYALGANPAFVCDIVGALSVSLGGAFMALFARRVTNSEAVAYVALGLYALLFSLSPWVSIPYSDTYVCGFIGAELYLSARLLMGGNGRGEEPAELRPFVPTLLRSAGGWLALGLVALVGYLIKPTAAIVLMATVVVWLVWLLRGDARPRLAQALGLMGGLLVAAVLVVGVVQPASHRGAQINDDSPRVLGMSHFFMMGQNAKHTGGFWQNDVTFSGSMYDPEERTRVNIETGISRIQERGVIGNLVFYAKKMMFSFGDGSFSWSVDGGTRFFTEIYPESGPGAHWLRSLFYYDEWQPGANRTAFMTVTQVLWYAVLVLWAVAGLAGTMHPRGCARVPRGGLGFPMAALVPLITLMGMCLYLLIFEDRARYLYCFGPVSVACAAIGLAAGVRALGSMIDAFVASTHPTSAAGRREPSAGHGEPQVPGELPAPSAHREPHVPGEASPAVR